MKIKYLLVSLFVFLLAACGPNPINLSAPDPTATAAPTATPSPTIAEQLKDLLEAKTGLITSNDRLWEYAVTAEDPKGIGLFGLPEGYNHWDTITIPTVKQMYWNTDIEIVRENGFVTMTGPEGTQIILNETDYPNGIFFSLWIKTDEGMAAQMYKLEVHSTN